jgi:hypothetical protein
VSPYSPFPPANILRWPLAGAGAYVFAKREINADRKRKMEQQRMKKEAVYSLEYSDNIPAKPGSAATMGGGTDNAGSPSREAAFDPAATRHEPTNESQRVNEKGKHESTGTYRSPKGDRFS